MYARARGRVRTYWEHQVNPDRTCYISRDREYCGEGPPMNP